MSSLLIRLQLYKPSKRVREDQGTVLDIWKWWKSGKRYITFLENTVEIDQSTINISRIFLLN
jgi:hypothetical protein